MSAYRQDYAELAWTLLFPKMFLELIMSFRENTESWKSYGFKKTEIITFNFGNYEPVYHNP